MWTRVFGFGSRDVVVVVLYSAGASSAWSCAGGGGNGALPDPERPGEEAPDESWVTQAPQEEVKEEAAPAPQKEPEIRGIPTECASNGSVCTPPSSWVRRLCENVNADIALYLFRPETPFQRLYLRGKTEAVNASGGASVAGYLEFDEEVLALRHRATDEDGIQVGDAGGTFDALRWNGSCVSLDGGEVTTQTPPSPKASRVEWRWLGDGMRQALLEDATVKETFHARQKECKGATMGAVSKKCETLDRKLTQVIVDHVRGGAKLPEPQEP